MKHIDRVQIHEATNDGFMPVTKQGQENWYNKEWLNSVIGKKIMIGRTKADLSNILKNAQKYEGIKYGWINIFMHAISMFLKLIIGNGKLKYTDEEKTLHCSEGVSRVLYDSSNKKVNFADEYSVPFDVISPAHIYLSSQVETL